MSSVLSKDHRLFLNSVIAAGAVMLVDGLVPWHSIDMPRFCAYLALAMLAAVCRIEVPSLPGNYSLTFVVVVMAIVELSLPQALVIGGGAVFVQSVWRTRDKPAAGRLLFSTGACAIAIVAAFNIARLPALRLHPPAGMLAASLAFYLIDVGLIAAAVSTAAKRSFWTVSKAWVRRSAPYQVAGTAAAAFAGYAGPASEGPAMALTPALALAPMLAIYFCSRRWTEESPASAPS